jgi:hypothetical protein
MECFHNAQRVVLADKTRTLQYVEGYRVHRELAGHFAHHAWATINGKVIDPTPGPSRDDAKDMVSVLKLGTRAPPAVCHQGCSYCLRVSRSKARIRGKSCPHTSSAKRVGDYRRTKGVPGYESAVKDGRCLTMVEAAEKAGVSCHAIRVLIRKEILPAKQFVFDAPWQILAADLERPEVQQALRSRRTRAGRPLRISRDDRTLKIPGT